MEHIKAADASQPYQQGLSEDFWKLYTERGYCEVIY